MKTLTIILIILISTSCLTVRRIEKNCDLFAKICITETETEIATETETEIEYRDTIIYVEIFEKKVKDKIPIKIIDEKKKPVPVKKEYVNSALSVLSVPFAESHAQVVNSRLEHELIQTDTLLLFKLENVLKTVKTQEKQIKVLKEKYVVPIKENTKFAKFAVKWFIGSLVVIILIAGILFLKFQVKILGFLSKFV